MSFIPKNYYSKDELIACSNGKLFTKDGDGKLPSDQMLMFDEINRIDNDSGTYKKGSIEATLNINPDLWFFKCHFNLFIHWYQPWCCSFDYCDVCYEWFQNRTYK